MMEITNSNVTPCRGLFSKLHLIAAEQQGSNT